MSYYNTSDRFTSSQPRYNSSSQLSSLQRYGRDEPSGKDPLFDDIPGLWVYAFVEGL